MILVRNESTVPKNSRWVWASKGSNRGAPLAMTRAPLPPAPSSSLHALSSS